MFAPVGDPNRRLSTISVTLRLLSEGTLVPDSDRTPSIPAARDVYTPKQRPRTGVRNQPVTRTAPWYSAAYQASERLEICTTVPVWGAWMNWLPPM
jgi:hypothetical protein